MVFADVGANQGEVTLFAARRLTQGTAIAFEPTADNFSRLTSNVRLNGLTNVVALNYCLGSEPGEVELFAPEDHSHHHRHGWNEGMPSMFAPSPQAIPVARAAVHRLDDVLPAFDVNRLDVLKIDVEGAELDVLCGAQDSIRRFRPVIVVEINADTYRFAGYEPINVCAFLQSLDYDGFELDRAGNRGKRIGQSVSEHCDALWISR
jgi:FkbM family methyltransferase